MPDLALCVLGPLQISCAGAPVTGLGSNKVRGLLIYLAVEADRPHARAALAGLLWPDQPPAAAQHNLRQALANLRRALGDRTADPPFLLINRETVQLTLRARTGSTSPPLRSFSPPAKRIRIAGQPPVPRASSVARAPPRFTAATSWRTSF